jgi:hypothetical protein
VFLVILGDGFVLKHFLQLLVAIAADVAHGSAVILKNGVNVFGVLFATLFGERRPDPKH